jgi:DNA-binding SARP family transcriptional activator
MRFLPFVLLPARVTLETTRDAMLRLNLFGGFSLLGADGATMVIASRKCRALLAYLALQPRPVAREQLAGLLWGDGGEARARGSLRQALTVLRQEIPGDDWLAASAETVAIDRRALWVDALAAHERLQAGELAAALELCGRGELLEGLSPGALEFEEWRDGERRRWREREVAALVTLADRARQAGNHRQLLALGRRLLVLEPWNEEAHRSVMHALAASGRRSEALRQYRQAVEALRAELGVAPDARTEALMVQIRSARTAPAARDEPSSSAAPTAPAAAPDGGPVGRVLENLQIEGLLRGCMASGRGHVVLIRGEAGMGKTTLLRQALEKARGLGLPVHLVEVNDAGAGRSTEVLRGVLGALDAGTLALPAHRLALNELLGDPLDAGDAAMAAALHPDARAEAHARALEALLAAAGARQARLIAVEDLHWCDAQTVGSLCAIASAAPQHRTLVVFTCRSGEEPADLAWSALLRRGSITSIDLGPLPPEEAAQLAARHAGHDPEVTRRCLERAGGHPLFLVQLLESGAADDSAPQSVTDAVLARLARVSPAERRVLDGAAVVAGPVALPQMQRLFAPGAPDPGAPAETVVDRLVQQGWLRIDGGRLALTHDLVAGAIRSGMDPHTRAELHRWAAECFAGIDPLRSAEHLDHAGDPGAALAYLSVARDALGERRLDAADSALTRIDGLPADPAVAFAALCLRGDVRRERGDAAGSHDVFARAATQARGAADQARAQLGMAAALRLLDRQQEALARVADAEARTAPDDHATRAALEQLRGNLLFTAGELAGCRSAHERALAHARQAESPADEVAALSGLGDAAYLGGRLTSARRAFASCRELAREHGILRMEAAACMMLATIGLYDDQLAASIAFGERALELADRITDPRLQSLSEVVLAGLHYERGAWAAARAHAERSQAAARRLGSEGLEAMGAWHAAQALLLEGRRAEALRLARQAFTLCQRGGGLAVSGPAVLATLALAETDVDASRAAIRQGEALLAAGGVAHAHFQLREAAMALALARSEWDEARRHADAFEAHFGAEPPARAVHVVEQARLLSALGASPGAAEARRRVVELRERARAANLVVLANWPASLTAL